jgi:hypothetical protein
LRTRHDVLITGAGVVTTISPATHSRGDGLPAVLRAAEAILIRVAEPIVTPGTAATLVRATIAWAAGTVLRPDALFVATIRQTISTILWAQGAVLGIWRAESIATVDDGGVTVAVDGLPTIIRAGQTILEAYVAGPIPARRRTCAAVLTAVCAGLSSFADLVATLRATGTTAVGRAGLAVLSHAA